MISAAELRIIQANSNRERFVNACNKYYNILIDECKFAIEHIQNNDMSSIILNNNRLISQTDGYSYTTMLFGFWDKQVSSFNTSVFRDYNILSPLERATRDLELFGYKLEYNNDSMKLVLKISF